MKNFARPFLVLLLGSVFAVTGSLAQSTAAPATKTPSTAKKTPAKTGGAAQAKTTQKATTAAKPTLATERDKASYAVGLNVGVNLRRQLIDVDPAMVAQGLKDAFSDSKPLLTEEEIRAALTKLQQDTRAKQEAKLKEITDTNKKEGEAFLAANKSKEGVVVLPSGLQYKVLKAGTGPKPTATDTVVCNYRGTLLDGKEFDSSYKRNEPATFPVSGVIKGWTEALQLMPVGSKWQLFVPADLAYGDRGAGADIAPGSTLIFEVELVSIKPKEATAPEPTKPEAQPQATKPGEAKPGEATKPGDTTKPNETPQPKK